MLVRITLVMLTTAWLMSMPIASQGVPQSTDRADADSDTKDTAARQKIL